MPEQTADQLVQSVCEVMPECMLTQGLSIAARGRIAGKLTALAQAGRIRRFSFDGRMHVAPADTAGDAAFILDWALGLCRCNDAGCHSWIGFTDPVRGPAVKFRGVNYSLRRLVYASATGKALTPLQSVRPKCGNEACLNPDHLRAESRVAALKGIRRPVATRIRMALKRRQHSPYTDEQLAAVRAQHASGQITAEQAAEQLGISLQNCREALAGRTRRDFSNPFLGLAQTKKKRK